MKLKAILIIISFIILSGNSISQISIRPSALFIESTKNTGRITIMNTSSQPREITVDFQFGYVDYDSVGKPFINYHDSIDLVKWSLEPMIKVYPKQLIIPPNEEQVVRFRVTRKSDMPIGVYYTRVFFSSKPLSLEVDTVKSSVQAGLELHTQLIGAILYLNGESESGLKIGKISYKSDTTNVNIFLECLKSGQAPFYGTLNLELRDESGNIIGEHKNQYLGLYKNALVSYSFDKNYFRTGQNYKLNLKIDRERDDIPDKFWLSFSTIEKEQTITFSD